jgi:hypothetical protein
LVCANTGVASATAKVKAIADKSIFIVCSLDRPRRAGRS